MNKNHHENGGFFVFCNLEIAEKDLPASAGRTQGLSCRALVNPGTRGKEELVNALGHLTSHSLPLKNPPLLRQSRRVERLQIGLKSLPIDHPYALILHEVQHERFAAKVLVFPHPYRLHKQFLFFKKYTLGILSVRDEVRAI